MEISMSFVSGILISMIEKELTTQMPEVEAYALQMLGQLAKDIVLYVEKKAGIQPSVTTSTNGS
jgi:hypothetical protein